MATICFRFLDNPYTLASASLKAEIWRKDVIRAVQITPQTRLVPITERAHHADPQKETDASDGSDGSDDSGDERGFTGGFTVTFPSLAPGGDPVAVRLPSPTDSDDTLFTVALYSVQPECEARPNRLVVRLFASFALTWHEAGFAFASGQKSFDIVLIPAIDDQEHGWATVTLDEKQIKRPPTSSRAVQLADDRDKGGSVATTNDLVLQWCEREQSRFLPTVQKMCGNPLMRRLLGFPRQCTSLEGLEHLCPSLDAVWGASGASWGDGGPPRFKTQWYYTQLDRELLIRGHTWDLFQQANAQDESTAERRADREAARREASLVLAGAIARWSATRRYVRDWRGDGFVCSAGDRGDCTQAAWTSYHAWLGALEFPDKLIRNVAIWTGIPCLAYGKARCAPGAPLESHCWCIVVPSAYFVRATGVADFARRAAVGVERVTILDGAIGTTPDFAKQSEGYKNVVRPLTWISPDIGKIETQLDDSVVKTYECVSRLVTRMFPGSPLPLGANKPLPRGDERKAYSFVPEHNGYYGVEFASLLKSTLRHLPRADPTAEARISRFDRPIVKIDDKRDKTLTLQNRLAKGRVVVTLWRHRLHESFERLKSYAHTTGLKTTIVEYHSCVVFSMEW